MATAGTRLRFADKGVRETSEASRRASGYRNAPMILPEPDAKLQSNIGVPSGILAANDAAPDRSPGSPWSMPAGAKALARS
jgi:hypothetical protein